MIIAYLVVAGLILGSFVNALVWRFHEQAELREKLAKAKKGSAKAKSQLTLKQLSMTHGRSMCSNCHHELAPKDLIPLFSWLLLRGRCRYCHQKIQDSPLIEALLPVFFVISYLAWPQPLNGVGLYDFGFWLVFVTAFMALAAYDIRWYLLPDRLVFPLQGLAIAEFVGRFVFYNNAQPFNWNTLANTAGAIAVASGIFYALYIISNGGWIGGGDVKLGVVLGLLVGTPVKAMLMLFVASLLGLLAAVPGLAGSKSQGLRTKIPFGPFLIAATFVVVLWGQPVIDWYLHTLLKY